MVKQGVTEVVVEIEQLWPRLIDEWSYINGKRLWRSGVVAR
jgi:hypothetical protein